MEKQWKQWQTIFLGSKITAGGDCGHEIKRCLLLGRKVMTNLDLIKNQRRYFANKGPFSQSCGFYSSHVWIWHLDYKESWAPKNWCFWTVVLEKTLESPLDCKEIQPVHPKGNQSWIFIGRTDAEAEAPILWLPGVSLVAQMVKSLPAVRETGFDPWVRKVPWIRKWQPTPVFVPGKSHGWRSLEGYSLWVYSKESDMAEWLHFLSWPPDVKNQLNGKDPDAGKDWRQEEKRMTEDKMFGWHHQLKEHEFEEAEGVGTGKPGMLQSMGSQRVGQDWVTELTEKKKIEEAMLK